MEGGSMESIEARSPIEEYLRLFRGRSVLKGREVLGSEPQRERRGPPPPALPADVQAEILARLPARSVARFLCASKAWYAMCCDRAFAACHHSIAMSRRRDYPDSFVFFYYDLDERRPALHLVCSEGVYEVPIGAGGLDVSPWCRLVGSCNGLLCLSEGSWMETAYVCNPLIRKCLTLPPAATPGGGWVLFGFGFDPRHSEFKAVRVWDVDDHYACDVCAIGPSGVPSPWRTAAHLPVLDEPLADPRPAVVEGNIHWLVVTECGSDGLLSFDLESEQFRYLLVPDESNPVHVAELRGHLSILCGSAVKNSAVDVWVMKEYGNEQSWTKELSISNRLYNPQDEFFSMRPSCLCSWKDSEILIGNGADLISYNSRSKKVTDFPLRWLHDEGFVLTVVPHINSLLWLEEEGVGANLTTTTNKRQRRIEKKR